jgi:HlyD family secretion protein
MKLSKWFLVLIIIVVAAVSLYVYRNGKTGDAQDKDIPYKEFEVTRGDFRSTVSASGVVVPINRVQIKSKASGLITEMPVEEGDAVKKGELICRLDPTDVQAEVDQARADLDIAEAELKQAENTYQRQKELYDRGLLSDEELDQVNLQLTQAKGKMVRARIALDQAQVRLSETVVVAPINGIILQKYVEVGQIISSGISNISGGSPIADIADMDQVHIEAGIDEIDVGKIRIGQIAQVIADAYPQKVFRGKIIRIAPEAKVEQNVTLFDVIIQVENQEGLLKSGMNASVEIITLDEKDVLLVPSVALQETPKTKRKPRLRQALVKEGNRFQPRPVQIGSFDFNVAVVISGLKEGDIVGVPMTSRLKKENEWLEERIKSSRSFGGNTKEKKQDKR